MCLLGTHIKSESNLDKSRDKSSDESTDRPSDKRQERKAEPGHRVSLWCRRVCVFDCSATFNRSDG